MLRSIGIPAGLIIALVALGCGGFSSGPGIDDQQYAVSECDGFGTLEDYLHTPPPPADYCAAEVLHWEYQAGTETLRLADARVLLNCCGEHSMTIDVVEDVYVVTETDDPEMTDMGPSRCSCMCVFDFTLEAAGIPQGTIQVRLVREISDWEEASGLIWEGELDLGQGNGAIVIDETYVEWCGMGD